MRSLSIFALLAVSASLASATTVSFGCTVNGAPGATYASGAGSATFNCSGFAAPLNSEITNISILGRTDYQFGNNPGPNTFQISFALPVGFSANPLISSISGGESSPGITGNTANLGSGLPTLSYSAFSVVGTGSTTAGAVFSGSGTLSVTYTYEAIQQNGNIPEPSTLALVGGILALAGIRKFRK